MGEIKRSISSGKINAAIVFRPRAVIDGHMHVMSGHCTPMPLVWHRLPQGAELMPPRSMIDKGLSWTADSLMPFVGQITVGARQACDILNRGNTARREIPRDLMVGVIVGTVSLINTSLAGAKKNYVQAERINTFISEEICEVIRRHFEEVKDQAKSDRELAQGLADELNRRGFSRLDKDSSILEKMGAAAAEVGRDIAQIAVLSAGAREGAAAGISALIRRVSAGMTTLSRARIGAVDWVTERFADIVSVTAGTMKAAIERISGARGDLLDNFVTVSNFAVSSAESVVSLVAFGDIQQKPMSEILDEALRQFEKACGGTNKAWFTPLIHLPMDMDRACINAFDGNSGIYTEVNERYCYRLGNKIEPLPPETEINDTTGLIRETGRFFYFLHRTNAYSKGIPRWAPVEEGKMFVSWKQQMDETIALLVSNPWKIMSMFHYDPRRWKNNPDEPFSKVIEGKNPSGAKERIFIGFKMYPPLGFKPWDIERLSNLKEFYKKCAEQEIPVLSHCGPGGMYTHDREYYLKYDLQSNSRAADKYNHIKDSQERAVRYFQEEYTSPAAWEQVLKENKRLKLCLAHFGGDNKTGDNKPLSGWEVDVETKDLALWNQRIMNMIQDKKYPNLYTDISYFMVWKYRDNFAKALRLYPRLRERVIFGTDWYMIENDGLSLDAYVRLAKEAIVSIDQEFRADGTMKKNEINLWKRFTMVNPFEYYAFDAIANAYHDSLIAAEADKEESKKALGLIARVRKEIDRLREMEKKD